MAACLFLMGTLLSAACAGNGGSDQLIDRLNAISRPFNVGGVSGGAAADRPIQLHIVSIGDILVHYPWQQEFDNEGNSVFPEYFQYIRNTVLDADLALCNIEGVFAGGEPAGYPLFNIGDTLAPAVRNAGFDIVYTSHNHMLDQHPGGILRTLEVLHDAGLQTTGSRLDTDAPNYALTTVQGVNIAVISYTYESSLGQINGLPVPKEMDPLINSFTADSEDDLAEMGGLISEAREAGADLVIFYLHAGTEYSHEPDSGQRETAQFLADNGADIIFGSHVHVVQPMELLQPTDGSTPVPIYWGMGNFISGQVIEWDMELANEEGIMADLVLTWNPETEEIDSLHMNYLPLWNCFYDNGGRTVHTVIPEQGDVSTNPSIQVSGHAQRALDAFAEVHDIMGEGIRWQRGT